MGDLPMWRRYLRFHGADVRADLEEELRFHLEERIEELMNRGMSREQAEAEAARRFGDLRRVRAECQGIAAGGARARSRREWLRGVVQDLGYAARVLRRSPGFTLVAVLTLALGMGANTAIFSVVNSVLLRPLPVAGLDRLVVIREDLPFLDLRDAELSPPEVLDLAARRDLFDGVVGIAPGDRTLTGQGEPKRIAVAQTLGGMGEVFGVRPVVGRMYDASTSLDGPHEVAVVSHGLWQQLSGGDPRFVGRTIELNGVAHEVVGVMPPEFRFPREVQVWLPFAYTERWKEPQMRGSLFMTTVARPRAGLTPERLAAGLQSEAGRWNEQFARGDDGAKELHSTSLVEFLAGPLRLILLVLMGAVVFVLLIAAANVASLQMVRSAGRARETAVRTALGAGRGRVVRYLLMESVLLAAAGGVLGLAIGAGALRLLRQWAPAQEMGLGEIPLDGQVLAFTAAVALLSAVAFGTVPALRASRVAPQEVLRESGRGAVGGVGRSRLLRVSVVVQVALALVLLLGSGLMIRTLARLLASDPGFDPQGVLTAQVSIPSSRYDSPERRFAFFQTLLEEVEALPGVSAAALASGVPFGGGNDSSPFEIPGRPPRPGEPERHAEAMVVSERYFATLGIPLLRGRGFDGTERPGAPMSAVIDQTFAEQFFPGADPIGQQIIGYFGDPATIVGVAGRVDHDRIGDAPKATAYYSVRNAPWAGTRSLVVRSTLPVGTLTDQLRAALAGLDPNVPLYDVQTMEGRIQRSIAPQRLAMTAMGAFAGLALLLAALGVYGVMRYTTGQRTREIGIRMAVGAQPRDVLSLVLRQGVALTAVGLVAGLVAAVSLSRLMSGILFGITPHDPPSMIGATLALALVALLATWLPARKALRVDPVEALRAE